MIITMGIRLGGSCCCCRFVVIRRSSSLALRKRWDSREGGRVFIVCTMNAGVRRLGVITRVRLY